MPLAGAREPVGNTLTGRANRVGILQAEPVRDLMDAIDTLVREWQPALLVVGLPLEAEEVAA